MSQGDFYTRKKIQDGDITEFEKLFEKYYEPLCKHANKILKDMDTAEDLVQELFYNLWKNRLDFGPKLSLSAYLFQSIRNNALHYLKHISIRQQYTQQVIAESQSIQSYDDQQAFELKELKKIIDHTLQLMPQRCSYIFKLNRYEGKKYREIAQMLSISVKTVEADMGKALQIFRKSLKSFSVEKLKMSS